MTPTLAIYLFEDYSQAWHDAPILPGGDYPTEAMEVWTRVVIDFDNAACEADGCSLPIGFRLDDSDDDGPRSRFYPFAAVIEGSEAKPWALCEDCVPLPRPTSQERERWYCHTCGITHVHTVEERDAHRDALMRTYARQIDTKP